MRYVLLVAGVLALHAPGLHSQGHRVDSTTTRERASFLVFVDDLRRTLVETADAMPATKYGFAPTDGEFANVRSFARQVKHVAATNYILAAAALGERPPADAGDERGPDSVVTKEQHLAYLRGSYDALKRAAMAIGDTRVPVVTSPISPLSPSTVSRSGLIAEALIHSYDHYGQLVVYLRMNGIIPPASRR